MPAQFFFITAQVVVSPHSQSYNVILSLSVEIQPRACYSSSLKIQVDLISYTKPSLLNRLSVDFNRFQQVNATKTEMDSFNLSP